MAFSFEKAFTLMKEKGVTQYYLVKSPQNPDKIGGATFDKMKNNEHINTSTLEKLCKILDCQPGDLMEYKPEKGD